MISLFLLFLLVGLIVLALIVLARSHWLMNTVSLAHPLAYAAIALYAMCSPAGGGLLGLPGALPVYSASRYFFLDHLGAYEIIIMSVVFFVAILYMEGYVKSLVDTEELSARNVKFFYALMNLLIIASAFSFLSNNLAVFWIFLELTTLFSAVLVVTLNAKENIDAALRYVFIASSAMLFSFIGLILLYFLSAHALGTGTLDWDALLQNAALLSPRLLAVSFVFIFIGFAAKSGIVPFHTWLPHAHAKAPSAVSAVLSGALLNIGIYGILRTFAIVHHGQPSPAVSWLLIGFGILSVAVASLSMLRQTNTKKFIAFSSIENMGILLIGIGIATRSSIYWSLLYVLAHALIKSLLFLCAGIINRQYHSNESGDVKDVLRLQPLAALGMILGALAIIGLPPFILFLPKLFLIVEMAKMSLVLLFTVLFFLVIVVAAFGVLLLRLVAGTGGASGTASSMRTAHHRRFTMPVKMSAAIVILIVLIIGLGLFLPQQLQQLASTIATELMF